jgi:hypothetical protein
MFPPKLQLSRAGGAGEPFSKKKAVHIACGDDIVKESTRRQHRGLKGKINYGGAYFGMYGVDLAAFLLMRLAFC